MAKSGSSFAPHSAPESVANAWKQLRKLLLQIGSDWMSQKRRNEEEEEDAADGLIEASLHDHGLTASTI